METIKGLARCVRIDDIDTDNIFHASLLTIHDPEKIKPHIFGNLTNFEGFGAEDNENKILIVGKNFGKGSTRQQAVTGFLAHKIKIIIGESFGPIYYSNAVNSGLLLVQIDGLSKFEIRDNDQIELDIQQTKLHNLTTKNSIECQMIPTPVMDIIQAGGLLEFGKGT